MQRDLLSKGHPRSADPEDDGRGMSINSCLSLTRAVALCLATFDFDFVLGGGYSWACVQEDGAKSEDIVKRTAALRWS